MEKRNEFRLLLVENDPGDVLLIKEALRDCFPGCRLEVAGDGEAALAGLQKTLENGRPRPDLILLDLNMPNMNGLEFLGHIKGHPQLRSIPTVVLTTSSRPEDVAACYDRHANGYLAKPADLETFFEMMRAIKSFWHDHATGPRTQDPRVPLAH